MITIICFFLKNIYLILILEYLSLYFDNLENICIYLDKSLKKIYNRRKNDFIILLIIVLIKESTNIIFKILKNKININNILNRINKLED